MTEFAVAPVSRKGTLRQKMAEKSWRLMGAAKYARLPSARVTLRTGVLGSRLVRGLGNLVAGKRAQVSGSTTTLHSFAISRTRARGSRIGHERQSVGSGRIAPHAPAKTQGQWSKRLVEFLAWGRESVWCLRS